MASRIVERVGEVVAKLRAQAGLSQAELAERLKLAPETISRLERGAHAPSLERLDDIAQALGVGLRDLLPTTGAEGPLADLVALLAPRSPDEIRLAADVARRVIEHVDAAPQRRPPPKPRRRR